MKEPTDHAAPVLTIEGRAHTLTPPRIKITMRLNTTPEEPETTADGTPIAGEISITPPRERPALARFDALEIDENGALWETAYFTPPGAEQGFFVYAPTTPAEAAQFLTENNALLRAVFGTPPQKPRRGPTIAPDAQRVRRHPERA